MTVSEILIASVGLKVGSRLSISGLQSVGILCASSNSFLSSICTLITNEFFQNQNQDILNKEFGLRSILCYKKKI